MALTKDQSLNRWSKKAILPRGVSVAADVLVPIDLVRFPVLAVVCSNTDCFRWVLVIFNIGNTQGTTKHLVPNMKRLNSFSQFFVSETMMTIKLQYTKTTRRREGRAKKCIRRQKRTTKSQRRRRISWFTLRSSLWQWFDGCPSCD